MADVVEVLVPGGKANPGPPLGPSLGPLGININKVVDEINKNFTVEVGTPPTSASINALTGVVKSLNNA